MLFQSNKFSLSLKFDSIIPIFNVNSLKIINFF